MRTPEFWNRSDFMARLAVGALTPFGWIYGATVACKAARARPYKTRAKVICIGNVTVGGTGKTPIALEIARVILDRHMRPVFLSRGYGGRTKSPRFIDRERDIAATVGDEPLLLASMAPVIVARDRAAGASLADNAGFNVIIMDDGHQNFTVEKDLSLVVVDADVGFANGRVVPAGPLREPAAHGLARADAVVLLGSGTPEMPSCAKTMLRAKLLPVTHLSLKKVRVVAFAGIGRPEKFFDTLRSVGAEIVHTEHYADHHIYTDSEISALKSRARHYNALLMTTEKDFVRLAQNQREEIVPFPVKAAFDTPSEIEQLLDAAGFISGERNF